MSEIQEQQNCPEHGIVLATRKTWPALFKWAFFIITFGTETADYPFRCPKCGRLTTRHADPSH